jgi:hypothetical protein
MNAFNKNHVNIVYPQLLSKNNKFYGIWVKSDGSKIWINRGLPGRVEGPISLAL